MLEIELKSQALLVMVWVSSGRQKVVIVLGGVVGWDVKNASLCLQQYRVV